MCTWTLEEPFGYDWGPEVVWRDVPAHTDLRLPLTVVVDGVEHSPAQVDGPRLAYITDLPAGHCRRYELRASAATGAIVSAPSLLAVADDTATIDVPGAAGLRLAWGGVVEDASLLALRRCDGSWASTTMSWTGATVESRRVEVLAHGPVLVRLRQRFHLAGGATVELAWAVDAASPATRLDIDVAGETEGELVVHLGDVGAAEQAYWRPHSPRPWRGGAGSSHNRQIYTVPGHEDEVEIGPFYNWARDAASFWTCWGAAAPSLLYVGWVRPSHTHLHGELQRLRLRTRRPGMVDLHIRLQRGRKPGPGGAGA